MPAPHPLLPAPVHDREVAPGRWRIALRGDADPLFLARILQRLAMPEVALESVCYAAGPFSQADVVITARAHRAALAAARLARLCPVRAIELRPEDAG